MARLLRSPPNLYIRRATVKLVFYRPPCRFNGRCWFCTLIGSGRRRTSGTNRCSAHPRRRTSLTMWGHLRVNTNASTPARVLFESLEGRWTLGRIVTGFGEMSGLASFRPLSRQVLEYREEGVLSLTSGTSHSASRTLFYLHQDDHILVCFRPSSRPKDLLHRLAVGRAEVPWPQNVDDTH